MKRVKIHCLMALAATLLATVALLAPAGSASAANATWSGASASDTWSTAANWSGGVAPSGNVEVLTLPASSAGCLGWACGFAVDDIRSLAVGTLQIDSSNNYLVAPLDASDSIELLKALEFSTTTATARGRLLTTMVVPLSLGATQTWNVEGAPGTPTVLALGPVTGEQSRLTLRLTDGVTLQAPEIDTGLLTVSGGGTLAIGAQMAQPTDGIPTFPPPLISAQGVELAAGASLEITGAGVVSGPITVAPGSYSTVEVGHGVAPDGTATVDGDLTLRSDSTVQLWIDQAAVTGSPLPSADSSQLTVSGNLDLNGAALDLSQGFGEPQVDCTTLTGGQVYTLIAATRLVGTFAGIANGQVIPVGVCNPMGSGHSYAVIISYNTRARPETMTATIVGPAQIKALVARALIVPAAATLGGVLAVGGYDTSFDAPAPGSLTLTWTAVSHGRRVTVASGSNLAGRVGPRGVLIKLTAAGQRLLYAAAHPPAPKPRKPKGKKKHKPKPPPKPKPRPVRITATASFTPSGQGSVKITRLLTLR